MYPQIIKVENILEYILLGAMILSAKSKKMNIIWHGHSCFEITGKDGTIVFDPYQANSVPGLNFLKLKANLVLCSHEHDDHNARNCVEVAPKDFKSDMY